MPVFQKVCANVFNIIGHQKSVAKICETLSIMPIHVGGYAIQVHLKNDDELLNLKKQIKNHFQASRATN